MSHYVNTVIPEWIQLDKPELVEFFEAYYKFLNQDNQPGHFLEHLPEHRDIDETDDIFIEYLQRELAVPIPENIRADKRKLYKNITDIYLSKGSEPSFKALFNLIFNDDIELFFPRVDILKPSDGKWDATNQRWLNDDGKVSVKKFIQDSRFYQSFSYVIKTGQTIDFWKDSVKKLLHPAGFAFFGQVTIFSVARLGAMDNPQPGRQAADAAPLSIIPASVNVDVAIPAVNGGLRITFVLNPINKYSMGTNLLYLEKTKFLEGRGPMSDFGNVVISDVAKGLKTNISFPSQIDITP